MIQLNDDFSFELLLLYSLQAQLYRELNHIGLRKI